MEGVISAELLEARKDCNTELTPSRLIGNLPCPDSSGAASSSSSSLCSSSFSSDSLTPSTSNAKRKAVDAFGVPPKRRKGCVVCVSRQLIGNCPEDDRPFDASRAQCDGCSTNSHIAPKRGRIVIEDDDGDNEEIVASADINDEVIASADINDEVIASADINDKESFATPASRDILDFDLGVFEVVCEVVAEMVVSVETEQEQQEDDDDDESTSLEEAQRLHQTICDLKSECARLREEKRRIEEEEEKRRVERDRLAAEIRRAKEEFARLRAECDRLKRNLAKQEEEIARLRLFLMIARERRMKATMVEE